MSKGGIKIHLPGTAFLPGDRLRISGSLASDGIYTVQKPTKPSIMKRLRSWITRMAQCVRYLFRRPRLRYIDSKQLDAILVKFQKKRAVQMMVIANPPGHPNPARIVIAAEGMLNQYGLS